MHVGNFIIIIKGQTIERAGPKQHPATKATAGNIILSALGDGSWRCITTSIVLGFAKELGYVFFAIF
jgi:hypothetical protein